MSKYEYTVFYYAANILNIMLDNNCKVDRSRLEQWS